MAFGKPGRPPEDRLARQREIYEAVIPLIYRDGARRLSMRDAASAACLSIGGLYHYFPNKRELFEAVLAQGAEEHLRRIRTEETLPPAEQLNAALTAFLSWIDENKGAYEKLMRSAGIPEVRELIDRVREDTARQLLEGIVPDGPAPPKVRAAVRGWLWYMDGVNMDWVQGDDMTTEDVHGLLLGSLLGALTAAGFDVAALLSGG